jgi:DNA-binding beta-propeller fold protein YncE
MVFAPTASPVPLAIRGPFAALTIDVQRRRVFAAGARSVAIIDADTGKLLATVRLGGARSIAIEPLGGHVFVGTQDGRISEIDPDRKTIVRSMAADGAVDGLLYDSSTGRLYADGPAAAALAVFDARSFASRAPVALPGGVPGQFVPDPITREFYAAYADRPEIAILDPVRGDVRASFPTPGLLGNRILRFDDALGQLVVVGSNGLLNVYDRAGTQRAHLNVPSGIAGCDLDTGKHVLACTGPGGLTFVQLVREAAPVIIGTSALGGPALVALDTKTDDAVVVHSKSDGSGADVQRWSASPPSASPSPSAR